MVVIATPFGAFRYKRLTFGLKTASAIFQREIDKILRKFPWARAYIDDIIVYADSGGDVATFNVAAGDLE